MLQLAKLWDGVLGTLGVPKGLPGPQGAFLTFCISHIMDKGGGGGPEGKLLGTTKGKFLGARKGKLQRALYRPMAAHILHFSHQTKRCSGGGCFMQSVREHHRVPKPWGVRARKSGRLSDFMPRTPRGRGERKSGPKAIKIYENGALPAKASGATAPET